MAAKPYLSMNHISSCFLLVVAIFVVPGESLQVPRSCRRLSCGIGGGDNANLRVATNLLDNHQKGNVDANNSGEGDNDSKTGKESQTKKKSGGGDVPPSISFIEGAVQKVTGDEDYKFGDYSKRALSELTGKDLDKEEYQFGDITKNIVNQAGKTITGRDDYVFGDITRGFLEELELSMEDWKGTALNELPMDLARDLFVKLDPSQRRAAFVAVVRLLAIALLTWGFVANLCAATTVTIAWSHACVVAGTQGLWSPFRAGLLHRQVFLDSYALLRLTLDPLFLVVQGAGTLLGIRRYQRFITSIEQEWISSSQRDKYPLLYRVAALALAFLFNVGVSAALSAVGVMCGTALGQLKLRFFPTNAGL